MELHLRFHSTNSNGASNNPQVRVRGWDSVCPAVAGQKLLRQPFFILKHIILTFISLFLLLPPFFTPPPPMLICLGQLFLMLSQHCSGSALWHIQDTGEPAQGTCAGSRQFPKTVFLWDLLLNMYYWAFWALHILCTHCADDVHCKCDLENYENKVFCFRFLLLALELYTSKFSLPHTPRRYKNHPINSSWLPNWWVEKENKMTLTLLFICCRKPDLFPSLVVCFSFKMTNIPILALY